MTPILLPDGKTTIPPVAINSMNKNKIGLKGNVQTFFNCVDYSVLLFFGRNSNSDIV